MNLPHLLALFFLLLTNILFAQVNVTYDINSMQVKMSVVKLEQVVKDVKIHDIQHPAEEGIFVLSSSIKTSNK